MTHDTITYFDIDSYTPEYKPALAFKAKKKQTHSDKMQLRKMSRVHRNLESGIISTRIGVDPEKILNWRELERTFKKYEENYLTINSLFWNALDRLHKEKTGGDKGTQIIVCVSSQRVIIYAPDRGYSTENLEWAIKRLEVNRDSYGNYTVISYNEGGEYVGRLLTRGNKLQKVALLYRDYFRKAILDRIYKFLETQPRRSWGLQQPYNMIIQNGDRTYIVTVDGYRKVNFLEGKIMCSTQQLSLPSCNPSDV